MKYTEYEQEKIHNACVSVKNLIINGKYDDCQEMINTLMAEFPHSAVPHNLYGILLEKKNEHSLAMNHFRAAWALDATYLPSRYNLDNYGNFFSRKNFDYYEEEDCPAQENEPYEIVRDERGIGI